MAQRITKASITPDQMVEDQRDKQEYAPSKLRRLKVIRHAGWVNEEIPADYSTLAIAAAFTLAV